MKVVNINDVLKILHKYGEFLFVTDHPRYTEMRDEIANLPNVTPQNKKGTWEYKGIANTTITGYWCSQCHIGSSKPYDYCPNCGAKMQEVEDEKC